MRQPAGRSETGAAEPRTDRCGAVDVIVSPSAALPDGRTGTDPGSAWSPIAASLKVLLPTTPEPIAASGSMHCRSLPRTARRVARALHRDCPRGSRESGPAEEPSDARPDKETPRIRRSGALGREELGAARSRGARSLGGGRRRLRGRCRGRCLGRRRRCHGRACGGGRRIACDDSATERGREGQCEQDSLDHDWGILRAKGAGGSGASRGRGRPRRRTIDSADERPPDFRGPNPCSGLSSRATARASTAPGPLGPGRDRSFDECNGRDRSGPHRLPHLRPARPDAARTSTTPPRTGGVVDQITGPAVPVSAAVAHTGVTIDDPAD